MPTLEERVAYLEGQVSDQSHALADVRDAVRHLELRMDARFEAVDRRFESVDRRFDAIEGRITSGFEAVDCRFERVEAKISSQFVWVVGIQVTTLVTIVGALSAALLARP